MVGGDGPEDWVGAYDLALNNFKGLFILYDVYSFSLFKSNSFSDLAKSSGLSQFFFFFFCEKFSLS